MGIGEANATNGTNSSIVANETNAGGNATNSTALSPSPAPSSDEEMEVEELEEEEEAPPTDYRVVPGEEHRTKFWTQASVKGLKQPVAIAVTSSDENVTN